MFEKPLPRGVLLSRARWLAPVGVGLAAGAAGLVAYALGRAGSEQTMAFVTVAAPALREPFGTVALRGREVGLVAALPLAPALLVELAKAVRRG